MWRVIFLFLFLAVGRAVEVVGEGPLTAETYNQWKEALPGGRTTRPGEIRVAPGFTVDLVRTARVDEGSWVAMAFDPGGGVVVAREDRGLLRLDPAQGEAGASSWAEQSLEEVRGLLFAHGSLYANANNARALVRLRDAEGDGVFEEMRVLRKTPGGVGHGRNQLALGPDGMIYSVHGDDVQVPEGGFTKGSPFVWGGPDRFLPPAWDRFNWSDAVAPPAGHVVRTDADGGRWEIVCGGLRNPFGLAFNEHGEMFTYDADMEWDVGLPWYRPTRVLHLASGADYGWRGGSRALPAWMPDTAPAAVDIGKGSPTAILFGTRSRFPDPWRRVLFVMDWAYGVIYAVRLDPQGASYGGQAEVFLQGRPLNVTGMDMGPDGALYFVTGGRRTQSALYRVSWSGGDGENAGSEPAVSGPAGESALQAEVARRLRQRLESYHGRLDEAAVGQAWPHLASSDIWIRQAARIALEAQPATAWLERAWAETDPMAALTAFLAAARVGGAEVQPVLREQLARFDPAMLAESEALVWARVLEISLLRHGRLDAGENPVWRQRLQQAYPHRSPRVNRLLCGLLCAEDDSHVVALSLAQLQATPPPTQEDMLHFLLSLRVVRTGWTLETRRTWLAWMLKARTEGVGAAALPTTLNHLRAEFEQAMSAEERAALAAELAALDQLAAPVPTPAVARPFQKAWQLDDFDMLPSRPPEPSQGRRLFTEAACAACHRAGDLLPSVAVGPDLTGLGQRFDRRALLESLLDPWKVVAPPYRHVSATLKSGAIHEGPVISEDGETLVISINPVDPGSVARVSRTEIARLVEMSAMPPGLLNPLTREEIFDLVAWLEEGAP